MTEAGNSNSNSCATGRQFANALASLPVSLRQRLERIDHPFADRLEVAHISREQREFVRLGGGRDRDVGETGGAPFRYREVR